MKTKIATTRFAAALCLAGVLVNVAAAEGKRWPTMAPAARVANAASAPILAAAMAGKRVVAVGDHGVVLLSDDGMHFRQADSVPVRSLLTTVQFVDARHGFAGGHDGVILATGDGGISWTLLRAAPGVEQPVLSLHFDNPEHGIAVGLYGWAVETRDGGVNWTELHIGQGDDSDRHLFHIFTSRNGTWLIAAEAGTVFRSADGGKSWQAIATGDQGSLWSGVALMDGTLLVCGMRGHIYRSADDGKTWVSIDAGTTQSLTGATLLPDGTVVIVGLNGTVLRSQDKGMTFSPVQREQDEPLTGVIAHGPRPLFMSMIGPVVESGEKQ